MGSLGGTRPAGVTNSSVFACSLVFSRPTMKMFRSMMFVGSFAMTFLMSLGYGEEGRPNVVVFLVDDMGWGDSGTYGNGDIRTPSMDRLASEGVKLTQCYSAAGVCSPSRAAILTGRTPYRNGVWRHLSGVGPSHLRESEITYPELLREVGYETCHVGKWHLLSRQQFNDPQYPHPQDHGYQYWMSTHNTAHPSHKNPNNFYRNGQAVGATEGYSAQLVAEEAGRWLRDIRDPSKPFALSIWLHEPHSPIATHPRFEKIYEGHENRKYMGNISQLDHALGTVLDVLDELKICENTFFLFTSDNGPVPSYGGSSGGLRGNKRSQFEGGIRVPGIVRWPGRIEPGTVSDIPVIGTDVFPTVLEMAGVSLPDDRTIDGVNMLPALQGNPVEREIPLFWRTHVSNPEERAAMRIGNWKIVADETLTKFQLYNISADPREREDLAKTMPEKTEAMAVKLKSLWAEIEKEGPSEWWKNERQRPSRGGQLNY
ncbi:MAG: sulfatase family protein [Puniceicoccales bacterium]